MKTSAGAVLLLGFLLAAAVCFAGGPGPLSNIPPEQRGALIKRLSAYVEAYRGRKWDKLYDLVSDVGKGSADSQTFIAAMTSAHGDLAQIPDLLEFRPDQTQNNNDGFDLYGCGKARRQGWKYDGIAVMHAVFEHNDWFFTGWAFTQFPNEPCKTLVDPKWQPGDPMKWDRPMEEVSNFKVKE
jgi:hypothetical protein